MTGLLIATIDYELHYKYDLNSEDNPRGLDDAKDSPLRIVVLVLTLLAISSILLRHGLKTRWLNQAIARKNKANQQRMRRGSNNVYIVNYDSFHRRRRKRNIFSWTLLFELIIIVIQPIPYYDVEITHNYLHTDKQHLQTSVFLLGEFLYALMFFRLFFVVRTIFNYSMYTDAYAKKVW